MDPSLQFCPEIAELEKFIDSYVPETNEQNYHQNFSGQFTGNTDELQNYDAYSNAYLYAEQEYAKMTLQDQGNVNFSTNYQDFNPNESWSPYLQMQDLGSTWNENYYQPPCDPALFQESIQMYNQTLLNQPNSQCGIQSFPYQPEMPVILPDWIDVSKPPPPLPWSPPPLIPNHPEEFLRRNRDLANGAALDVTSLAPNYPSNTQTPTQETYTSHLSDQDKRNVEKYTKKKPDNQYTKKRADNQYTKTKSDDQYTKTKSDVTRSSKGVDTNEKSSPDQRIHKEPPTTLPRESLPRRKENNSNEAKDNPDIRKFNVRSWLSHDERGGGGSSKHQQKQTQSFKKTITKMKETSGKKDLSYFLKMAQIYATTEYKLREVAEILCNQAIKRPALSTNIAVLCNRMSGFTVQEATFRNVILNIMQGHFKNNQQLLMTAIRTDCQDSRWIGLVTFLVDLYLNLRTTTHRRLDFLTKPIYICYFYALKEETIPDKISQCILWTIRRVGLPLQRWSATDMERLMKDVRDKCVTSTSLSHTSRKNLLSIVEMYAGKWKIASEYNRSLKI